MITFRWDQQEEIYGLETIKYFLRDISAKSLSFHWSQVTKQSRDLRKVTWQGNCVLDIERFHSRGQHLCKFMGTKESVYIRKESNSHRIGVEHQHGRRFIVLGHQYGRRDVMWKRSIHCRMFSQDITAATFVTYPSPIMHLIWPLKFCITFVFHSPGYYSRPKRNWNQRLCKIFGGK